MTDEEINQHEAGHATACLLLKIPVVGFGRGRDGGFTRMVNLCEDLDEARVRDIMIMLMSGWIMEPRELPDWPPSRNAYQVDERLMAVFADHIGLTKADWLGLCGEAYAFTATDDFDRLWQALTGLAEHTPTIDQDGLVLAQEIVQRVYGEGEGR